MASATGSPSSTTTSRTSRRRTGRRHRLGVARNAGSGREHAGAARPGARPVAQAGRPHAARARDVLGRTAVERGTVGELEWLTGRPYGIDFRAVMDRSEAQLFRTWRQLDPEAMPIEPKVMWTVDARSIRARSGAPAVRTALRWTPKTDGRINTLSTWFDAQFGSGIVLTNAPTAPRTHWGQFLFPLRRPRHVTPGQAIDVKFACIPCGPGHCRFTWSIREDGRTWEHGHVG